MPVLSSLADTSSSSSPNDSLHSYSFLQDSYQHHGHCQLWISFSISFRPIVPCLPATSDALFGKKARRLRDFKFEDILCQWGSMAEIGYQQCPTFIAAAGYLSEKYGIHHFKISPYNSRPTVLLSTNTSTYTNASWRHAITNMQNG